MQELNKETLKRSAAGMRLIALLTIYNSGDSGRLRTFVTDNYHQLLLESEPAGVWMGMFRLWRTTIGRLRVRQALAADKYHVVVLMEGERAETLFLLDIMVEEEHPHRIIHLTQEALELPR
jgi:hypothetical protein